MIAITPLSTMTALSFQIKPTINQPTAPIDDSTISHIISSGTPADLIVMAHKMIILANHFIYQSIVPLGVADL